ncbi:MAG: NUDIX hydrolase [Pseudolabrys sp.]
MAGDWPKIKARRTTTISEWMAIVERDVEFAVGAPAETYHAVGQRDYVAVVAMTPDGKIPIVRQYRPALERFTWELPAGLLDEREAAADCCRRELMEETGYPARAIHPLGTTAPCSGRLSNYLHSFFVETDVRNDEHRIEAGIELKLVTPAELAALILSGEFMSQLHIGTVLLAGMAGHLDLAAFSAAKHPPKG